MDREEPKVRRPARSPLLRALVDQVRGRVEARRRRAEFEQRVHGLKDATIVSEERSREVVGETIHGSPPVCERKAFDPARRIEDVRARWSEIEQGMHYEGELIILSEEGSREVEEEMARPPADTPGRRALFERFRVRAAMRARTETQGTAWKA